VHAEVSRNGPSRRSIVQLRYVACTAIKTDLKIEVRKTLFQYLRTTNPKLEFLTITTRTF